MWSLPVLKALDSDGDKMISEKELKNASKSLIKLDTNGDGNLTIEEIRPSFSPRPSRTNESSTPTIKFKPTEPKLVKEIFNHSTKDIMKLLGAEGIKGAKESEIRNYQRLFGFTDRDKDGNIQRQNMLIMDGTLLRNLEQEFSMLQIQIRTALFPRKNTSKTVSLLTKLKLYFHQWIQIKTTNSAQKSLYKATSSRRRS